MKLFKDKLIVSRQALLYLNFTSEDLKPLQTLDVFYIIRPPLDPKPTSGLEKSKNSEEPVPKKAKLQEADNKEIDSSGISVEKTPVAKLGGVSRQENEKSVLVFNSTQFDGLLICSKEHPLTILQNLLPHLAPAAPFAVYCQYPEVIFIFFLINIIHLSNYLFQICILMQ